MNVHGGGRMKKRRKKKKLTPESREAMSEAGKKGAAARWGDHEKGEPTNTVRCYVSDKPRLAQVAPKTQDAIRQLLDGQE